MKILMFPGQGAQYKGMGAELFDAYPDLLEEADDILGYSVRALCLDDPGRRLIDTRFTQPAIFVVSALAHRRYLDDGGAAGDVCIGHSLGEYSALHAAGMLGFADALRLVQRRGALMADIHGGAMCAVIGLEMAPLDALLADSGLAVDIANHNSFQQIVLSGPQSDIEQAQALLGRRHPECRVVRLRVSGAFHSRMMQPAAQQFEASLDTTPFSAPAAEVIANCSVAAYTRANAASLLARQLVSPVRWLETIEHLLDRGAADFVELGPGEVLGRLLAEIGKRHTPRAPADAGPVPQPEAVADAERRQPASPPATFATLWGSRSACLGGCVGARATTPALLAALADEGLACFAPSAGMPATAVAATLASARQRLTAEHSRALIGLNVCADGDHQEMIDLALRLDVGALEVAGFHAPDIALMRYRCAGGAGADGRPRNRLLAKVRSLDAALAFARPLPEKRITELLREARIDDAQARLLAGFPIADAICLDGSGWREPIRGQVARATDLLDSLRDALGAEHGVALGLCGGMTTPGHIVAARAAGADFVVLGSILHLCRESGISDNDREALASARPGAFRKVLDGGGLAFGLQTSVLHDCDVTARRLEHLQQATRTLLNGQRRASELRAALADDAWPTPLPDGDADGDLSAWIRRVAAQLGGNASARLAASPGTATAARRWRSGQGGWPAAAELLRSLQIT